MGGVGLGRLLPGPLLLQRAEAPVVGVRHGATRRSAALGPLRAHGQPHGRGHQDMRVLLPEAVGGAGLPDPVPPGLRRVRLHALVGLQQDLRRGPAAPDPTRPGHARVRRGPLPQPHPDQDLFQPGALSLRGERAPLQPQGGLLERVPAAPSQGPSVAEWQDNGGLQRHRRHPRGEESSQAARASLPARPPPPPPQPAPTWSAPPPPPPRHAAPPL